jgi:hypothetical protein
VFALSETLPPKGPEEEPHEEITESSEQEFRRELIGEPVMRPDGEEVRLYKTKKGIEVSGILSAGYTDEEVEYLGGGDWHRGVGRITQEFYKETMEEAIDSGLRKPLLDEIKEGRNSGLLPPIEEV